MKLLFSVFLLFIISCSNNFLGEISGRPQSNYDFSVLQGTTDSTSTVIRVVYPNFLRPIYKITDSKGKLVKLSNRRDYKRDEYEFIVSHLFFTGLSPDEEYTINISSQHKKWKDERTFKTLSGEGTKSKILVASCMSDTHNEIGNIIWDKALAHDPDLIFFTGDNIYADIYSGIYIGAKIPSSVGHLWRRHIDHAMTMKIYRAKKLVPSVAIWDDHDYGVNDGNKNYKLKKQSLDIFRIFFPSYKNEFITPGKGVGFSLSFRQQNFLFLDGRYYRDTKDKKNGHHLGTKQRNWLKQQVMNSNNLNWLILGDQFFGGYHPFESFEGVHPVEFAKFRQELKAMNKKFAFVSGDRHLVEVMEIPKKEIGHKTFEYTISGMHTKMYPGSLKRDPNPRRVDGFDGEPNYVIFELDKKDNKNVINFKAYSHEKLRINRLDIL